MLFVVISIILIIMILILMLLINFIISKKMFKSREKISSFECGFDPQSTGRMPFSLQFYLITIIFLIFDVEISMILPMIVSINMLKIININLIFIMIILLVGLYLEWAEGALKWFK